jgi:hypothetical protein
MTGNEHPTLTPRTAVTGWQFLLFPVVLILRQVKYNLVVQTRK